MNENISISDDAKREYIKEVIAQLESLKSQQLLLATFNVALVALTLSNVIFDKETISLSINSKFILAVSVISVTLAAGIFTIWASMIQVLRIQATDWMITLNIEEARNIHYPGQKYYKRWGWISVIANALMILGILGYLVFILSVIFYYW